MASVTAATPAQAEGSRWLRAAARFALLIAALAFVWLAEGQFNRVLVGTGGNLGGVPSRTDGWFIWLFAVACATFCFTLGAFFPSGKVKFRWAWVSALAVIPLLAIILPAAWVIWHWDWLPRALEQQRFYMNVVPQTAFAAFIGVAVASGIRNDKDGTSE